MNYRIHINKYIFCNLSLVTKALMKCIHYMIQGNLNNLLTILLPFAIQNDFRVGNIYNDNNKFISGIHGHWPTVPKIQYIWSYVILQFEIHNTYLYTIIFKILLTFLNT